MSGEERALLLSSIQGKTLSPVWKDVFEALLKAQAAYLGLLQEEHQALLHSDNALLETLLEKKAAGATQIESLEYGFKLAVFECLRAFGMDRFSSVLDWFVAEGSTLERILAQELQALRQALQALCQDVTRQGQLNASLIQSALRYIHDLRLQIEPDLQARTQYGAKGQRASLSGVSQLEQTL